jgi:hypothetical protein
VLHKEKYGPVAQLDTCLPVGGEHQISNLTVPGIIVCCW